MVVGYFRSSSAPVWTGRVARGLVALALTSLASMHSPTVSFAAGGSCLTDTMTLGDCVLSIKRRLDPVLGNRDGFRLYCTLDACSTLTSPDPTQSNLSVELADTSGTTFNETISNPGGCVQKTNGYICKPPRGTSAFRTIRLMRTPSESCADIFVLRAQVRSTDLSTLSCDDQPWGVTFRIGNECSDTSCTVDTCDAYQTCN